MIQGAQYENGKVYIRYGQPIPKFIKINGKELVCNVQHGISMLVVDESDVPALLAVQGGCCGGTKLVFSLASELAVKVWKDGHY